MFLILDRSLTYVCICSDSERKVDKGKGKVVHAAVEDDDVIDDE